MRKRKPGKEWRYIYEGDEGHDNRPDYPDRSEYHPDTYGCGDALHRMPAQGESLVEAAFVHGIDVDRLVDDINQFLASE